MLQSLLNSSLQCWKKSKDPLLSATKNIDISINHTISIYSTRSLQKSGSAEVLICFSKCSSPISKDYISLFKHWNSNYLLLIKPILLCQNAIQTKLVFTSFLFSCWLNYWVIVYYKQWFSYPLLKSNSLCDRAFSVHINSIKHPNSVLLHYRRNAFLHLHACFR